jgi:hypothetical protein
MPLIDIHELRDLFSYDPETGHVHWIAPGKGRIKKKEAGTIASNGYVGILIHGKRCYAHRIAWALHHGAWPDKQIDHVNGDKTDNRICNLRLATNSENGKNYGINKSNTSGAKGVFWCKETQKWRAIIKVNGRSICKGRYADKNAAIAARQMAEIEYFGEWRRA